MSEEVKNLDALINEIGFNIVEKIRTKGKEQTKYKNFIDKVLGVLSNDGVYAYWVYCKANKIDDVFIDELKDLMKLVSNDINDNDKEQFFQNLSTNIHQLLFFKDMVEKALIYARYHAKAMGD